MPRIGLVGCGRWGRFILRDLLSLGAHVTVAATADHAETARAAGAEVVAHIHDLPAVDGFVVATPTSTHADVIEALLPRGVPIYCEKPLCDDAERAWRLVDVGAGRIFVMDKWRYHTGILALAAIAHSGELGPVVGLKTTRLGYGHPYTDTDGIWTLLPHDLSIAREIFGGQLPPQSAVADRVDGEMTGMIAVARRAGGPWHVADVGTRSMVRHRAVALFCRDGVATLEEAMADHISIVRNPSPGEGATEPRVTRRSVKVEMPLLAELAAFLAHLDGGPQPKSSVREAAETVETIARFKALAVS